MKGKLSLCMVAAGFFSGIAVLYLFIAWPFPHFVKSDQRGEFYKSVNEMTTFFTNSNDDFKLLESYFDEKREWDFTFYQYECILYGGEKSYYYRTMGENESKIYSDLLERDEISMLSANLKEFLDFTAESKEILNVVLHGDYDVFDPDKENKRYLEVRCHEGEEIISYLYAPLNQLKEENWEQLIELENGWYLGFCQYIPIKLRGSISQ